MLSFVDHGVKTTAIANDPNEPCAADPRHQDSRRTRFTSGQLSPFPVSQANCIGPVLRIAENLRYTDVLEHGDGDVEDVFKLTRACYTSRRGNYRWYYNAIRLVSDKLNWDLSVSSKELTHDPGLFICSLQGGAPVINWLIIPLRIDNFLDIAWYSYHKS